MTPEEQLAAIKALPEWGRLGADDSQRAWTAVHAILAPEDRPVSSADWQLDASLADEEQLTILKSIRKNRPRLSDQPIE